MRRRIATALATAALAAAPLAAHAGKDLAFSIGIAGPGFALQLSDPAPVHYRPAPVYYPSPVFVRPAPVVYAPRPVYVAPAYYPVPVVVRPGHRHRHHHPRAVAAYAWRGAY